MFLEWYHLSKNAGGNCPDYLGRAKLMKPQFSLCENGITNTDCLIGNQTGTGGAVCKGATPSVEQPGGRGFKPRLRSLLD